MYSTDVSVDTEQVNRLTNRWTNVRSVRLIISAQPTDKSYAIQLLDAQNKYRAKHGVPLLKLNDEMNREAQK